MLIFDQNAKAEVRRVVEYAESHKFSLDDMLDRKLAYDKLKTIEGYIAAQKNNEDLDLVEVLRFLNFDSVPTEHELFARMKQIMLDFESAVPGNNPNFVCEIREGFRVAYTVEDSGHGYKKHLSISLIDAEPGRTVSPDAVAFIMHEFGFKNTFAQAATKGLILLDEDNIVNVLESLDGN